MSRRSLICGLGLGAGAALLVSTAPQVHAAGVEVSLTPGEETTEVATTAGTTMTVPVLLGGILTVAGGNLPAGTRIALSWSSALYTTEEAPAIIRDDEAFDCAFEAEPTDDGATGSAAVLLGAELPEGTFTLVLGSVRALTYPDDIIAPPTATTIALALPDGDREVTQEPADTGTSTDLLWGATIGVTWTALRWADGFRLWKPDTVALHSVGPSPVPAGTVIDVQVDAGAFTDLAVGPEDAAASGSVQGTVLRASYPIPEPVAADTILVIPIMASAAELSGELASYEPALLALTNAGASSNQRLTGLETATREDNAVDVASKVFYGMDEG
ncbi:hypothetical protein [Actinomyces qiguomingii]|uniref:hypothetical protein n=1 Tax=Actinomyces qiguomingii TaxID=2057800 RepID=UPI000FFE347F|nr:hypothetical protein [Actinomyces qiguomingii]